MADISATSTLGGSKGKLFYTKCGKSFRKSTEARVTGNRLSPSDLEGFCMGCDFIKPVYGTWEEEKKGIVKAYECRCGSEPRNLKAEFSGSLEDQTTLRVMALDRKFLNKVVEFAKNTVGCETASFTGEDLADCREALSISFAKNKKGVRAKQVIAQHFFPAHEQVVNLIQRQKKNK